ncbi:MAG: hypothetical protein CFE46_00780 [Burkholderiales bacterium PBB6]|nr:MAG: hypothetical protein CFE46_00780 [Burkholderiales bacterium PBB6]
MNKSKKFSPGIHERAVGLLPQHPGMHHSMRLAIKSIATKIKRVAKTLLTCVKRREVASGLRERVKTSEAQRVKEPEREVKQLRQANEVLKVTSALFAREGLARRFKPLES